MLPVVASALASVAAWGQPVSDADDDDDADIEIVVVEDGAPRVTGSAYVVGAEDLEQYESNDIHAVVGKVPGVYVRGEDGFGLRPNIGIRGANADRSAKITLMEDGVLLAPAPYAAPAAYYFPMVTRMVGLEVFKGPAAIQHGPHTVGGAINLLTRSIPDGLAGAIDVGGGSFRTAKAHAWAGGSGRRFGWLAEGVLLHSGGFKELDGGGPTGFDHGELMLKGQWRTRTSGLDLKLGYTAETSYETYLGLHPDDYADTPLRRYAASQAGLMVWDRTQAELAWPLQLSDDVELRTVAYHHGLVRAWTKFNRFAGGPDVHALLQQPAGGQSAVFLAVLRGDEDSTTEEQALQIGTNDRRFVAQGVQSTLRWRHTADGWASRFEAGVRVHSDRLDRLHTEDPHQMRDGVLVRDLEADTEVLVDSRARALAVAAHVHDDLELGALHVVPGARVESVRTSRSDVDQPPVTNTVVLPGLGLLAEVAEGVDLFGGAHRGFSPVAPGQPPEVVPESSWNLEAGLRAGGAGQRLELVGYVNDYVNLTGQCTISGGCDGDLLDQQFNGGRVWVAGVEAVAQREWLLPGRVRLPVEATYTYTFTRFRTGFVSGFPQFGNVAIGDALPYVPAHQGALQVSLASPRVRLGAAVRGRSGMLDAAGTFPVPDIGGIPALVTVDAALDVRLTDHWLLYVTGSNLGNALPVVAWRPFGARPQAPRQLMLGIKVDAARSRRGSP
ncbi:MAG: TonB-dependent receptor [Myxococcales bacterium]|nr:TonB-dependent receptor [Myxococcales bacterium]